MPTLLFAEMKVHEFSYEIDGTTFAGTATWSDAVTETRPLVLMVPNWLGPTAASLEKAKLIAGDRYVVVMADVYGVDVRPTTMEQAGAAAGALRADRPLLRQRARLALDQALALAGTVPIDPSKRAAIGFCFGGGTVLEMARDGVAVQAVISFHGNLDTPDSSLAKQIVTSVLVCHGAADPFVPAEQVSAFVTEMQQAEVADWTLVQYGGAVHSFTDPNAAMTGKAEYHERSAKRAFALMHSFLTERFAE
ncbi:MAG: dienelactone hydrolase family protein [Planctomycetota bacterium]|nr:dienelactone hydrolase family protein [Planctomycetota bacterium]